MDESLLDPGTEEYRRARRRRQNRESASRVRALKKEHLEAVIKKLACIEDTNSKMEIEIARLRIENQVLKNVAKKFNKVSFIYAKATIVVLMLCMILAQNYSTGLQLSSILSITIIFSFLVLILFIK